MRSARFVATRWLGVGLCACIAALTLVLAATGRIGLYINPESAWFAVSMAVVALVGTVASFALPLGAEDDHGHDHGGEHREDPHTDATAGHAHAPSTMGVIATVTGGVIASGVVGAALVLPPATLSAELAMARDTGTPPLFQGDDLVQLATTGDTADFGVGDWAAVFATATNPDAFIGDPVTLTGFVTPGDGDGAGASADFDLSRLVITHCVIDAQPASVPVVGADAPTTGQWVEVDGIVRASADGQLAIEATEVREIDEPADPYEF